MSEVRTRHKRRSHKQWREIVRRGAASAQSVEEFCAEESIGTASYYLWRKRLRAEGNGSAECQPAAAHFVELGSLVVPPSVWDLELELGGEVVLRLRRS